jgi:hypothetical protein
LLRMLWRNEVIAGSWCWTIMTTRTTLRLRTPKRSLT